MRLNLILFFKEFKQMTLFKVLKWSFLSVLFLILLNFLHFSFFSLLIFFLLMLKVYFSQTGARQHFRTSFWVSNLLFVIFLAQIENLIGLKLLIFIFYGVLMFLILGLMNLFFKEKFIVYNFVNLLILLLLFSGIFAFHPLFKNFSFWQIFLWSFGIFWGVVLVLLEFWKNFGKGFLRKERFWSYLIGLLALELSMILVFLPLGFFNAAIFLTLILLILRNVYLAYENGSLNFNFIFKELTIFVIVTALISLLVNWRVY